MKMEPVRFTSIMEESTNKLWGAHFGVPPLAAASLLNEGEARRVVCRLNDVVEYQCAMLPRGDGTFVISVNKKLREKLGLQTGSSVQVSLHKDESEYGLPMPEELAELIAQDPEAGSLLHALTPGKLRTLLYIVGQPKNPDTRLTRALVIVEHIKAHQGKIDYKKLNLDLQAANKAKLL